MGGDPKVSNIGNTKTALPPDFDPEVWRPAYEGAGFNEEYIEQLVWLNAHFSDLVAQALATGKLPDTDAKLRVGIFSNFLGLEYEAELPVSMPELVKLLEAGAKYAVEDGFDAAKILAMTELSEHTLSHFGMRWQPEKLVVDPNVGEKLIGTNKRVNTVHRNDDKSPYNMVIIHSSELNGYKAAEGTANGSITYLVDSLENRYIEMSLSSGRVLSLDPNRIWSAEGIEQSYNLLVWNKGKWKDLPEKDRKEILAKCEEIKATISRNIFTEGKAVVALHQNYKGGDCSVYAYEQRGYKAHANSSMSASNFVIVSNEELYELFVKRDINVVLQNDEHDGSLIQEAERRNIPYINIEAERGDYKFQNDVLKIINEEFEKKPELASGGSPSLRSILSVVLKKAESLAH